MFCWRKKELGRHYMPFIGLSTCWRFISFSDCMQSDYRHVCLNQIQSLSRHYCFQSGHIPPDSLSRIANLLNISMNRIYNFQICLRCRFDCTSYWEICMLLRIVMSFFVSITLHWVSNSIFFKKFSSTCKSHIDLFE